MCVNGLQIPSHSHVTVLQQVSECTEKPHRASSQEAAEKKQPYSLIPELQHQLSQIKGAVPKFPFPCVTVNCGRVTPSLCFYHLAQSVFVPQLIFSRGGTAMQSYALPNPVVHRVLQISKYISRLKSILENETNVLTEVKSSLERRDWTTSAGWRLRCSAVPAASSTWEIQHLSLTPVWREKIVSSSELLKLFMLSEVLLKVGERKQGEQALSHHICPAYAQWQR